MKTNRLVILNPTSPEPEFALAADAVIVDMPGSWEGGGKELRKALDSGLLVQHPVGRAVGKPAATETKAPATKAPTAPPAKK